MLSNPMIISIEKLLKRSDILEALERDDVEVYRRYGHRRQPIIKLEDRGNMLPLAYPYNGKPPRTIKFKTTLLVVPRAWNGFPPYKEWFRDVVEVVK